MYGSGQTPQPAFQVDLQSHGLQSNRDLQNGSVLPYTMDFASDGSLWVAFPTEPSKPLPSRGESLEYGGKVLRIGSNGEAVQQCDTGPQRWNRLRLFAQSTDGFTLETANKLVAYDAHCNQRAVYPTDGRVAFVPSPDRSRLYTKTRENRVLVLSSDNLNLEKTLQLPDTVGRNRVLFGDHVLAYPVTIRTKSCWQSQFSKVDVSTGQTTPWETIDCARFNLLGDDHIVYSESGGDAPLRITGGSTTYNPPHDFHLDLSVVDGLPVESSESLRIVEELIEMKGRHPSLDMSGKFVGRSIVLLDMRTGTALLTVKVPMDSEAYAYALSRDGKTFAVLLNSKLAVYRVP
jgi:hypothetical protein